LQGSQPESLDGDAADHRLQPDPNALHAKGDWRRNIRIDSRPQGCGRQHRECVLRLTPACSDHLATLPVVAITDGCRASLN
jgi:hypothetical protein